MPPIALSHAAKGGPTKPELRAVTPSKLALNPDDRSIEAKSRTCAVTIEALAEAESPKAIERHLDATIVDLEEEIAGTDPDDPEYGYKRGRLVAVRDAELAIRRLTRHGEGILHGLESSHHVLHEAFPVEE